MNATWHERHALPKSASLDERIAWHREHQKQCGCRPIPAKLSRLMTRPPRGKRDPAIDDHLAHVTPSNRALLQDLKGYDQTKSALHFGPDQRLPSSLVRKLLRARIAESDGGNPNAFDRKFARIVAALSKESGVTVGGKGFGSSGLKYEGKLFAMISSRGKFVVKLPRERVDELVENGLGERFDPGHGRRMKEWFAMNGGEGSWLRLAQEAYRFVRTS